MTKPWEGTWHVGPIASIVSDEDEYALAYEVDHEAAPLIAAAPEMYRFVESVIRSKPPNSIDREDGEALLRKARGEHA